MMARLDRCEVCDYSKETGSSYGNVPAYHNGEVRLRRSGAMICDACCGRPMSKKSSLLDDSHFEEVPDEDDEGTSSLPGL